MLEATPTRTTTTDGAEPQAPGDIPATFAASTPDAALQPKTGAAANDDSRPEKTMQTHPISVGSARLWKYARLKWRLMSWRQRLTLVGKPMLVIAIIYAIGRVAGLFGTVALTGPLAATVMTLGGLLGATMLWLSHSGTRYHRLINRIPLLLGLPFLGISIVSPDSGIVLLLALFLFAYGAGAALTVVALTLAGHRGA